MEQLIGKIAGINTNDSFYNLAVTDKFGKTFNLKLKTEKLDVEIGHVYQFEYKHIENEERVTNLITSYVPVASLGLNEKEEILREFFPGSPLSKDESIKLIYSYLDKIDNKIIYDITKYLIEKNKDDFFVYPAASIMHHAFVGGLVYHCSGMLHMADSFLDNYPYLDKNYLYAGIMLHDIGKLSELSGVEGTKYTNNGQLIGHLVSGALEIEKAAVKLGYEGTEEAMILEHMLISHHGQPQFGSAKKPATAEALALWYIDTLDSKFRVLGEELAKVESGTWTENVGVLDRTKIFKA